MPICYHFASWALEYANTANAANTAKVHKYPINKNIIMSKYLRNYKDLDIAKADETIVSPNMSSIEKRKLLHLDTHMKGEELVVIGNSLAEARLVKKYIADTTSNPELITLARNLGWIDSEAEKMSVRDAMAVTTVNDSGGHSLLSDSGLKSFDEFEYFTGVQCRFGTCNRCGNLRGCVGSRYAVHSTCAGRRDVNRESFGLYRDHRQSGVSQDVD